MPVSLVEWSIPAAILLCSLGFIAAGVMGFSTIRWGGALCFLGAGFGLMLIQMESPSIVKPIAEDVLILMGVAFACRSEEHTSELQSLMRISYAVFFLKKQK